MLVWRGTMMSLADTGEGSLFSIMLSCRVMIPTPVAIFTSPFFPLRLWNKMDLFLGVTSHDLCLQPFFFAVSPLLDISNQSMDYSPIKLSACVSYSS